MRAENGRFRPAITQPNTKNIKSCLVKTSIQIYRNTN